MFKELPKYGNLTNHQYLEMYRHIVDLEEDLEAKNFELKKLNYWKNPTIIVSDKSVTFAYVNYGFMDDKPAFKVSYPFENKYFLADEIKSKDIADEMTNFVYTEFRKSLKN